MRSLTICVGFILLSSVAVGAPSEASVQTVMDFYKSQVDHVCPAKHLDWLSAGDLNYALENFEKSLPPSQETEIEQTANVRAACAHTIAGIGCANVAYIRAVTTMNLLPRFVESVCKFTCVGLFQCQ